MKYAGLFNVAAAALILGTLGVANAQFQQQPGQGPTPQPAPQPNMPAFSQNSGTGAITANFPITYAVGQLFPTSGLSGFVGLANGGLNQDLTLTGGTSKFVRQNTLGGAFDLFQPACASLSNAGAGCSTSPIQTVQKQFFTATGTYTPTTGMVYAIAECVGGGAGGGGAAASAAGNSAAGGGGSGGYSRARLTAAQIGASQAVTIPAASAGGAAGNNSGVAGGDVSLGTLLVCKGGSPGTGAVANGGGNGGAGGIAGTGDIAGVGQAGGSAIGASITTVNGVAGQGGSTEWGGASGIVVVGTSAQNGAAAATNAFGAGGNGGASNGSAATASGGAGAKGAIMVTEFLNQ